jgi:putative transposase
MAREDKWGHSPFASKKGQACQRAIAHRLDFDSFGTNVQPLRYGFSAYLARMPRPLRFIYSGHCYHVLNRANYGTNIFHEPADYLAFVTLMARAQERVSLPIIALCLMPNHMHLVVRPTEDGDIARWLHWLCTTHARHYHKKHSTMGRLWQGRYKAFLVQDDHHLLTLIRYVERNALRKNLVERAEDWRWGSLNWRIRNRGVFELTPPPLPLPSGWVDWVNLPQTTAELEAIRTSVNRQRPFGESEWVEKRAREAGLVQSMVPVGRPRRMRLDPIC